MDNATIIANYCKKKLFSSEVFPDYMYDTMCFIYSLIDKELFPPEAHKHYDYLSEVLREQRHKSKALEEALSVLQSNKNNFVGIKGLFIQKAYYPPDQIRLTNDVDIIAKSKYGFPLYLVLKKGGFLVKDFKSLTYNNEKSMRLFKRFYFRFTTHLEMVKAQADDSFASTVEIHHNINMDCPPTKLSFEIDRMINGAIMKRVGNFEFQVFAPEDNLLYLMYHTVRHLGYASQSGRRMHINIQDLYDVAQIICLESVDWDVFCKKANKYNILPFVSLYLKAFSDVFHELVPQHVINDITTKTAEESFPWKKMYSIATAMEAHEIILGDFRKYPLIEAAGRMAKATSYWNASKVWKALGEII
jgi:hypothetical protein